MSLDIYRRPIRNVGGVFNVESAMASFSGGQGASGGVSALVQNIAWSYPRDVREVFELFSTDVYRVLGRSRGTLSIGRILGANGQDLVEEQLFDACNTGGTMSIACQAQLCSGKGANVTLTFSNIFVVDYSGGMDVNDQMIRESLQLSFSGLSKSRA
jgi:hypothetical protein